MSERPNSKTISLYVGVDVSKDFLDFDLLSNEAIRIENASEPIDAICAKTDPIDSKVISKFGIVVKPLPTAMNSNEDERRSALVTRRSQLLELITREKNRFKQAWDAEVKQSIQETLSRLEKCSCPLYSGLRLNTVGA